MKLNQILKLLAVTFVSAFLISCDQQTSQTNDQAKQTVDTNKSLLEQGREILYNAETRFEYPKAISIFENIIAIEPANAEAHFELIYAYLKQQRFNDAKPILEALLPIRNNLSVKNNLWLDAFKGSINDDNQAEILAWEKVTENYPEDRWGFYELSIAYSIFQHYEKAAEASEIALRLEPEASKWGATWIYYLYSKSLYRSGQYEKAIQAANAGKENATSWRSTFFRMKLAEIKNGNLTDVQSAIDEYIAISNTEGRNNLTYTHANIALFYFELGDYQNAEKYARMSYEADQSAYQTWTLGFSLIENGKHDEALNLLSIGTEIYPNDFMVQLGKVWALYRLNRLEEARTAILKAKDISPRKHHDIEKSLETVNNAITNPEAPKASLISWLG